jgi:hypothetical protein
LGGDSKDPSRKPKPLTTFNTGQYSDKPSRGVRPTKGRGGDGSTGQAGLSYERYIRSTYKSVSEKNEKRKRK